MAKLTRPDFVVYSNGLAIATYCKVCGKQIGRMDSKGRFMHLRNHTDMKIKFADGSAHVTCLCKGCVKAVYDKPAMLLALYEADIRDQMQFIPEMESYLNKEKPRVSHIEFERRGIR